MARTNILLLLDKISYIYYSIYFKNNKTKTLINLSNKVNNKIWDYIVKLRLKTHYINIKTVKINSFIFKIFKIILTSFYKKSIKKKRFF